MLNKVPSGWQELKIELLRATDVAGVFTRIFQSEKKKITAIWSTTQSNRKYYSF